MPPAAQAKTPIGKDSDPEKDFFKPTSVFGDDEAAIQGCRKFYEALRQQDPPDDIWDQVKAYWWARDPDYCFTCLHIMLIYGHNDLFERTIKELDRDPSAEDLRRLPNGERLIFFRAPDQQSLLHVAIVNNRWEAATFLLLYILNGSEAETGLKPSDRLRFLRAPDGEGSTALMLAAERGSGALVKELVKYESGMADDRGFTALMRAYISPRHEIDGLLNSGMTCDEARIPKHELGQEEAEEAEEALEEDDEEEQGEPQKKGPLVTEFLETYRGPYLDVLPDRRETPKNGVSEGFLNPCFLDEGLIAPGCTLELTPSRIGVRPAAGAAPGAKLVWRKPSTDAKNASDKLVGLAKWFGAAKRGNKDYVTKHLSEMYKSVVPQLCGTDALMFCSLHRQGEIAKILAPKLYTSTDANNYTALYKAAEYVSIDVANVLAPFQHGRANDEEEDKCYAIEEALRGGAIPLFKLLAPYELWIDLPKFEQVFADACEVNDAQYDPEDPDSSAKDDDYDELARILKEFKDGTTDEAKDARLHFNIVDAIRKDSVDDLKKAIKAYEDAKGEGSILGFESHVYPADKKKTRYNLVALALIYDKYRNDDAQNKTGTTNILTYLGKERMDICNACSSKLGSLIADIECAASSPGLVHATIVPAGN